RPSEQQIAVQPVQVEFAVDIVSFSSHTDAKPDGFELSCSSGKDFASSPRSKSERSINGAIGPDQIEPAVGSRTEHDNSFSCISKRPLYICCSNVCKIGPDENSLSGTICECGTKRVFHSRAEVSSLLRTELPGTAEFVP